ncbi:MAG: hypothetical protein AAB455_00130 [Patescibacteria group bacterium]
MPKPQEFEKRNRVEFSSAFLMVSAAVIFDLVQVFLVSIVYVGWIASFFFSIFVWLTFYLWTSIKGWGLSDTVKQAFIMWVLPPMEELPIFNALPIWTLRVVLQISWLKAEDTLYNKTHGRVDAEKLIKRLEKGRYLRGSIE